ncbi:MAG: hypothetical protein JWO09_2729 [Bacteroidetes bacterium]|nr:hypothetical protein [Bacteroidota bacterium]
MLIASVRVARNEHIENKPTRFLDTLPSVELEMTTHRSVIRKFVSIRYSYVERRKQYPQQDL